MKHFLHIHLNPKRSYGLDILRALAILFVVVAHGRDLLPPPPIFKSFQDWIVIDGVAIFFVLSGYLIGGILIKTIEKKHIDKNLLFDFWIRRWFRTLPNYFLVLTILGVIHAIFVDNSAFWRTYKYYLFAQNLFTPPTLTFFSESWSLSIEEWFYLLVPSCIFLLILQFKVRPHRSVIITAISILVLVTGFRYFRYSTLQVNDLHDWDAIFRKQVSTRLDSLMYGVIGAYINFHIHNIWKKRRKTLLYLGIALFVLDKFIFMFKFFSDNGLYNCVFSFSLTSIATILLLPYLSTLHNGKGRVYRFFTFISLISYSMYLFHLSIIQFWVIEKIPWGAISSNVYLIGFIKYFAYWFLTIGVSVIVYKYFEIPIMHLRDHPRVKKLIPTRYKKDVASEKTSGDNFELMIFKEEPE